MGKFLVFSSKPLIIISGRSRALPPPPRGEPNGRLLSQMPADLALASLFHCRSGPAQSFGQLCAAFRLVHNRYVRLGYMEPHCSRMRYSLHQLLPGSATFITLNQSRLCGTATVVLDSPAGLPLDRAFKREADCGAAAETTLFACRPGAADALALLRWSLAWCRQNRIESLYAVVHPKHVRFWVQQASFEELSEARPCPHAANNPGILLKLSLTSAFSSTGASQRLRRLIQYLPSEPVAPCYRPNEEEAAQLLLRRPDLLHNSPRAQRRELALHQRTALAKALKELRTQRSFECQSGRQPPAEKTPAENCRLC